MHYYQMTMAMFPTMTLIIYLIKPTLSELHAIKRSTSCLHILITDQKVPPGFEDFGGFWLRRKFYVFIVSVFVSLVTYLEKS